MGGTFFFSHPLAKGKLTCCNSRVFAQTNGITELARMSDITAEASTRASADTNLQNQVNSLKSSVSNGKTLVANAVTGKGVATSPSDTFATMANNIGRIQGVPSGYNLVPYNPCSRYEASYSIDLGQKYIPYWAHRSTAGSNDIEHCILLPNNSYASYRYITNVVARGRAEPYYWYARNYTYISDRNYRMDLWEVNFYPSRGVFDVIYKVEGYSGNGGGEWFEFAYLKRVA